MQIAMSSRRVIDQTPEHVNQWIRRKTEIELAYYAAHPQDIDKRLDELDREWDVERALETGASCLSLFGLGMSILSGRKWILLPLVVQGFFLQHSLQGWCPPIELFRRLGFRTEYEIDQERYALKALRGDFKDLPTPEQATSQNGNRVLEAVRK